MDDTPAVYTSVPSRAFAHHCSKSLRDVIRDKYTDSLQQCRTKAAQLQTDLAAQQQVAERTLATVLADQQTEKAKSDEIKALQDTHQKSRVDLDTQSDKRIRAVQNLEAAQKQKNELEEDRQRLLDQLAEFSDSSGDEERRREVPGKPKRRQNPDRNATKAPHPD